MDYEKQMIAHLSKTEGQTVAKDKKMLYEQLPNLLLPWFQENARSLPWRKDTDPYHVWLSEIMLQQTRVSAVEAYYKRFLLAVPTIEALAQIPEDELFKLWEGLGYYNRARNLQRAARIILQRGGFPKEYEEILQLPGVGPYTAGAIASICFNQPTPAVDGNVLRVIARYTEDFRVMDAPSVKKEIAALLSRVYPGHCCGDFTQSLMELGAVVCLPNGVPKCDDCPLRMLCGANRNSTQMMLPTRAPKRMRKMETRTVFMLVSDGCIAVRKRPNKGLLAGLYELPNVLGTQSPKKALLQAKRWGVSPVSVIKSVKRKHIFTHIEWHMTCHTISCAHKPDDFIWADKEKLKQEIALPTAFSAFVQ